MVHKLKGWAMSAPATALVVLCLILPVSATIALTFYAGDSPFDLYWAFLTSGFRRTVLWRTLEVSLITTALSLVIGFFTAYVVSRAPPRWRSVLIIMAVFSVADRRGRTIVCLAHHSRAKRDRKRFPCLDRR